MDAVHKAAFRGPLGRSLYMSPDSIGTYSTTAVSSLLLLHCITDIVVKLNSIQIQLVLLA